MFKLFFACMFSEIFKYMSHTNHIHYLKIVGGNSDGINSTLTSVNVENILPSFFSKYKHSRRFLRTHTMRSARTRFINEAPDLCVEH